MYEWNSDRCSVFKCSVDLEQIGLKLYLHIIIYSLHASWKCTWREVPVRTHSTFILQRFITCNVKWNNLYTIVTGNFGYMWNIQLMYYEIMLRYYDLFCSFKKIVRLHNSFHFFRDLFTSDCIVGQWLAIIHEPFIRQYFVTLRRWFSYEYYLSYCYSSVVSTFLSVIALLKILWTLAQISHLW